ncbi:LacI family DNA-binding transcriptional regulator [Neobacillus bataviensis]|uniref:LacI family DNA-binding transcriptional regulator n=1 Tax=Neobacillus bataviensis TaxID=220685 RepID=UPI001CBBF74D|nr:LacI family DNA-binding transcriptional regulator [Neobacillus bataviensis]
MSNTTIKDIAKELNISIATVSRVLNNSGYASPEVKERVLAAAKKLNYRPNAIARSLKKHQTNTIGIVIPDISNPFFMKISRGIEDVVLPKGYNLIFASGDENPQKERKMLQVLFEKRVDAIAIATSGGNEETIRKIKSTGVPIILVDRKIKNDLDLDYVVEDNVQGAYQLTAYLLQNGHTRIGLVNGSQEVSTGYERFEGFNKAMAEYGVSIQPEFIYDGEFTTEGGFKAAEYFLSLPEMPTAILSCNNVMTFGVLLKLAERGIANFEDLIIASYGENDAEQLIQKPKIISIKQSPYEMGVRVGEILLDRLVNNDETSVFETITPIFNNGC